MVVVEVVLVVEVVVDDAATRLRDALVVVARSLVAPSSRPWNAIADVDTTAIAATMHAPITHDRLPNRPMSANRHRERPT